MNINQFLLQTVSYALAGSFVVLVAHYLFGSKPVSSSSGLSQPSAKADEPSLLALRLAAHERMSLYVDRINPTNLLPRLFSPGVEVRTLQALAVNEIKAEFQHNITQQLYVDATTWQIISKLKDDTIAMINSAVEHLPKDASGIELSKMVLTKMSEITENPYELTLLAIKQPIHKLV
jgi:hypothetical protein